MINYERFFNTIAFFYNQYLQRPFKTYNTFQVSFFMEQTEEYDDSMKVSPYSVIFFFWGINLDDDSTPALFAELRMLGISPFEYAAIIKSLNNTFPALTCFCGDIQNSYELPISTAIQKLDEYISTDLSQINKLTFSLFFPVS